MKLQIVRTKDQSFPGFIRRYIFGLNLLPDEEPELGTRSDPRLVFLREIVRTQYVAGLIDRRADGANRLEHHLPANSSQPVVNSILGGEFFGPESSTEFYGLYLSKIEPNVFDFEESEPSGKREAVAFRIIYSDGLALFVSSMLENASLQLSKLLRGPIVSNEDFLQKAVQLYDVVLTTHADGDFFACYARNPRSFEMLTGPIDVAVTEIGEMPWFQASKDALAWDERYSMCLVQKQAASD